MSTLIYIALLASILQVLKLVKMWKYWQKISLIQSTEGQLSWIFLPSTEIPLIRWCRDMGQNQLKYLTWFLDPNVSKCIQNQNFRFFSFFLLIQYEWFHSYLPIYGQTDPKTTIVTSMVVHLFKYRKLSSLYLLVKQMWIELVFLQLHRKTNGFLLECSRSGKGQRYFKIFFNYCD